MSAKIPELKTLGENIRRRRESLELSQEALAHSADVDRSYLGAVERGERNITFLVLCRIARALNIDVGLLVKGAAGGGR